jgi:4-amino-4-deoxy-L-arabinose transferase-like glycosyltransferase
VAIDMKAIFPKFNLTGVDWGCILICSIPAFYMLGTGFIHIWDEAVYVNASWDMAHGSSWWVPSVGDYNTKPPLVLWLQALSLLIVPSAEWAVRLPSAFAVVGILLMMQIALKRWGFDFWTRLIVMVGFVGHEGFIRQHISRTGDLDAVMTFFVAAYSLLVLDAIQQKKWTGRHMYFFFFTVVCAFYAKSIAGWMMLGPLLLVWLLSPIRSTLFTLRFWMYGLLSVGICGFYYVTRARVQPGFLDLVWHSEYQRMFHNVMPWHEHGPSYYFQNFVTLKFFTPWIYFLAASVFYALFIIKQKGTNNHLLKWIILGFGYMLVITFPAVKLEWYDAPAYPFFAMILGVVIGTICLNIPTRWRVFLLIPVCLILWRKLDFTQYDTAPRDVFEYEGAILRQSDLTSATKVFMKVETPEHQLQLDFYRKWVLEEKGLAIPVIDTVSQIQIGDQIIISQTGELVKIHAKFDIDTIATWKGLGYTIGVKSEIIKM